MSAAATATTAGSPVFAIISVNPGYGLKEIIHSSGTAYRVLGRITGIARISIAGCISTLRWTIRPRRSATCAVAVPIVAAAAAAGRLSSIAALTTVK